MSDQQKLSRGQFLALVGGMALTVVLYKFSSVKRAIAVTDTKSRPVSAAYGNGAYGGKGA